MRRAWGMLIVVYCLLALPSQAQAPRVQLIAEGLYFPAGLAALPDGGILIAEAGGQGERSAGISLLQSDGTLGRLLSFVPTGRVQNGLFSAPVVAVTPDGADIIVAFPSAGLYSLPAAQAAQLPDQPLTPQDLRPRQTERGKVFLLHPFDIAFDAAGAPLISDAAGNGLVGEGRDRSLRYAHHFARLDNPRLPGGRLDALPTGITRQSNATVVALLGGCPHAQNSGELVAMRDAGGLGSLAAGLNMPIDVAQSDDGALWILEFGALPPDSPCFIDLDDLPASGRLSRLDANGVLRTILADLHFPSALLPMPDGSVYISEVYRGRLLRISFAGEPPQQPRRDPPVAPPPAAYAQISDLDAALRRVIVQRGLSAYPGRERIEPDSELTRLGRDLFFDPILSGDQNIACATCHHPAFAMADARALPIGAGGTGLGEERAFRAVVQVAGEGAVANPFIDVFVPRNSPTVINSALLSTQFWDGRVETSGGVRTPEAAINDLGFGDSLTAQAIFPITSQHEMAGITLGSLPPMVVRQTLLRRLRDNPEYAARFADVFGGEEINVRQLAEAIAAFERQLIFTAAPWDDYVAGDDAALSQAQKRGALLFFGEMKAGIRCAGCHRGDLFTDQRFHNLLAPQLGPGKGNGEGGHDDLGRANGSVDYRDQYRFKTPSLRNVSLTSPYLHSGAYRELVDVIWHHANPWRANIAYTPSQHLPPELQNHVLPYDFDRQAHSVARPLRAGLSISEADAADMVRFLQALTDPAAQDLSHILPKTVPSGLPIDALP